MRLPGGSFVVNTCWKNSAKTTEEHVSNSVKSMGIAQKFKRNAQKRIKARKEKLAQKTTSSSTPFAMLHRLQQSSSKKMLAITGSLTGQKPGSERPDDGASRTALGLWGPKSTAIAPGEKAV
jgi:hypothetical protein